MTCTLVYILNAVIYILPNTDCTNSLGLRFAGVADEVE